MYLIAFGDCLYNDYPDFNDFTDFILSDGYL